MGQSRLPAPFAALAFAALAACAGRSGGSAFAPPFKPIAHANGPLAGTGPTLWTLGDMVRVGPTSPPSNQLRTFRLFAARNETVSFQIAVTAPMNGLRGVRLVAAPFRDVAGKVVSTIAMALYREHFSTVTTASPVEGYPKSLGPGIYPDGLIPFIDDETGKPPKAARLRAQPIDLAAGDTQPYWIDVTASTGTPVGDYAGSITVSTDEGSATTRMSMHVWRFTMPHVPSTDSNFQIWEPVQQRNVATQAEILRNRLQPVPVNVGAERRLTQQFGLKMIGLRFWSGASYGNCAMSEPPSRKAIEAVTDRQALSYLYDQSADEIGSCKNLRTTLVPIIKRWAANLHAAGVLQLITMAPIARLRSDVDIWVMLAPEFERSRAKVAKALAHGDRAWFYTALSQDEYSPKWEIDVPAGDFPIVALIDGNLHLTGELYWALDAYQYVRGHDPWNDVESNQGGTLYAGEGILMYPAADVGTRGLAPSMRLKWLRDGMYDADEVKLLERCGFRQWAHAQTRTVAADFHHWTYDAAAIGRVQMRLGAKLDEDCPN